MDRWWRWNDGIQCEIEDSDVLIGLDECHDWSELAF